MATQSRSNRNVNLISETKESLSEGEAKRSVEYWTFSNSVAADIDFACGDSHAFEIITRVALPDLFAFKGTSTSMAGAISDGLHTTGTFFWNKTAELVNANNLVYHAKNSADSLTVTFYEDLSPTGDASGEAQEREALAHFTREHIAGLELDVRGACLFTGSIGNFLTASASVEIKVAHPEIQLRMQTDYKDYSCVCLGASPAKVSGVPETANVPAQQIELVMKTDYKDYSCLCLSDNTTISVPEKPITTAGHTFYYGGGWQKGDAVKDYAFTFTIRKEGPEKTVCVTFLREKKVENGKGPEAFAYLPLKGINYEGQFDVEGACEWHTQR